MIADMRDDFFVSVVKKHLGGVSAISPSMYEASLRNISEICQRPLDDKLRDDVYDVLSSLPNPD